MSQFEYHLIFKGPSIGSSRYVKAVEYADRNIHCITILIYWSAFKDFGGGWKMSSDIRSKRAHTLTLEPPVRASCLQRILQFGYYRDYLSHQKVTIF